MVPRCHKSHGVVDLDDLPGRAKRQAHVVVDGPIGVEIEIVATGLKRRRIAGIRQVAKDTPAIADPNVGTNVQETVGVCRCNHRATIAAMWLGTCATAMAANIRTKTINHTDLREFISVPSSYWIGNS